MTHRPFVVATRSLLLALAVSSGPALAQSPGAAEATQPTAAELLQSGRLEFEAGEFERAQRILGRVDPATLSSAERDAFLSLSDELEVQLGREAASFGPAQAVADPAQGLVAADELAQAGEAGRALDLYQAVSESPDASDAQRGLAQARMQGVRRAMQRDAAQVQRLLGSISEDLAAGRLEAAESKLVQLEDSGAELGWFDTDRARRLRAAVTVRKSQQEQAERSAVAAAVGAGGGVVAGAQLQDDPGAGTTGGSDAPRNEAARAEIDRFQADVNQEELRSDLLRQAMLEESQRELASAEEALGAGLYAVAAQDAERAVTLDPGNVRAQQVLAQAQDRAINGGRAPGAVSAIDDKVSQTLLIRAQANESFEAAMSRARQAQAGAQYENARNAVGEAKASIRQVGDAFNDVERSEYLTRADQLDAELVTQQRRAQELDAIEANRLAVIDADQKQREARAAIEREVQEQLLKARDLQRQSRFEEAIAAVERVQFLDPQNITADILIRALREQKIATDNYDLRDQQTLFGAEQRNLNLEATIPYPELLTYPKDWPSITQKRLAALAGTTGDSEADLEARELLQTRVSVAFDGQALEGVIGFIRDRTTANIVVNWPALQFLGITRDQPISIPVSNVPAERLLQLVLDQISEEGAEVSYSVRGGIVTISTAERLREDVDARVYDIRDLLVRVPNFPAPQLGLGEGGGEGGGGGLDFDNSDTNDDEDEDDELRQERIDDILLLIETTVGDELEWGDLSTIDELNGQLIVKTTPENHLGVSGLLSQLREQRAIQISVESRFLTVSNNFLDEFGIDLDLSWVGGAKFGPIALAQDSFSLGQRSGSSFGLGDTDPPVAGDAIDPNVTGAGRSLLLGASFIDDISVDLLISATLANTRSTSLNAPRITFFNGQRANVQVVTEFTYISDVEPVPDAIGFDITTEVDREGVILDVEGTVSADRRYVTLTLRTQVGVLQIPIAQIDIGGDGAVIDDDGNVTPVSTGSVPIQLPNFDITLASATVSVPDRGTLLLGGQRVVTENEVQAGVPVLSKLPILNRLFTNSSTVREESTLLILVKPTIIIQTEQEEEIFPGLTADPDSFNLGR
ncbi:MAG: hypothetical protein AAF288_08200 [Planctomycetota bacterium]